MCRFIPVELLHTNPTFFSDWMDELTHRQLVVESFHLDDQAVLAGHQFILQLRHFGLVGRLCQVVAQDVDQQVKQNHAGGQQEGEG